jgi:hypothetical protein
MLQELTFVDSVLLITVFDSVAVRGKFSCKNRPKFTARPGCQPCGAESRANQRCRSQSASRSCGAKNHHDNLTKPTTPGVFLLKTSWEVVEGTEREGELL